MTCNKQSGPVVGGVYEDPTLKNPTIIGGTATGLNLIGPDISGGISLDDATASILAKILAPYLPELVSSLFKNCEGNALPAGTQLMSCAEILKEIELAICRGCGDGGGGSGTDIGDRITSFTFDSTTRVLTINVKYADDTTKAWTVTLPASGGVVGDIIQNFVFDSTTGALTIKVTQADGSSKDWTVDISSLAPPPGGFGDEITAMTYDDGTGVLKITTKYADATTKEWEVTIAALLQLTSPLSTTELTQLPFSLYMDAEQAAVQGIHLMSTPKAWAEVFVGGTTFRVPLYKAGDPV